MAKPVLEWFEVTEVDDTTENWKDSFYYRSKKYHVFKISNNYHVVPSRCPHNGAEIPLSTFDSTSLTLTCPFHHYCFNIITGELISGASTCHLDKVPCRVREGKLYIGFPVPWWKF